MIHLSLAAPSFFSLNDPKGLDLARQPITLLVLGQISRSSHGQAALLELLFDHLPSSYGNLLVNWANLAFVHCDVGGTSESFAVGQNFSQAARSGLLRSKGEQLLNVGGGTEFRVGNQSSRELIETFAKLKSRWLVANRYEHTVESEHLQQT